MKFDTHSDIAGLHYGFLTGNLLQVIYYGKKKYYRKLFS